MPLETSQERLIPAARQAVAAYATDPANEPDWIGGVKRARALTDGPVGVGTRVERTAGFLGRSFDYVLEVTEHDPGRRLVMESVAGPFPMTVRYEFADAGDATLARISVAGEPGRLYRLTGPLMTLAVRRNLGKDLARLEQRVTS